MDADALSVARCTLKGSTFAFYVHMGSSFDDVVREIQSLFADVDLSGFILKYSLNGGAKCNLTTDRDVQMMLVSKRVAKSDFIDIEVVDTSSNLVVTENDQISDLVIEDCDPISNTDHALLGDKGGEQIVSMTDVWKTYITKVNQVFYGGTKEFRQQLTKYTIALGFKIKFIKNDKKRVTAVCAKRVSNGCPWRIHGSIQKVNGNFYIKTFNNIHTCGGIVTTRRSAMVNSRLVALIITNMIRENPLYRPTDIMLDMKSRYGLDVSYWNAWYGRELARNELHGNEDESYQQLVVYLSSVLDTNPGSHCRIEFDKETNRFTRCFVAFGACIKGFEKCRPLLCLDGTHLKSKHKGTLLVATGKNGDQGLYPLAFAVVDNESDENWRWFMEHLHHILESNDRTITFISDRNNGLINAIKEWFPGYPHAYCYHHLTVNIQSKFPGSVNKDTRDKVLNLFTICAYTFSKKRFNKAMEELKKEGGEVIENFLRTLPFKNWANSYFPGERYGEMCSNIVESFNSMVLDERTLPITQLIDGIRSRLMRFIGDRSHDASKWTSVLCPKFEKLLNAHVKAGEHWIVNRSSSGVYEVLADYTCKVDLFARTCTCPKWKLLGFPCVHAVTVIKFLDGNPYDYVEDYFKVETFRECYSNSILPIIQHVDDMPDDEDVPLLLPPKTKTQPGRPRTNRFKSTGEVGKIKCGRCGQLCGHNRRTCSENI